MSEITGLSTHRKNMGSLVSKIIMGMKLTHGSLMLEISKVTSRDMTVYSKVIVAIKAC